MVNGTSWHSRTCRLGDDGGSSGYGPDESFSQLLFVNGGSTDASVP